MTYLGTLGAWAVGAAIAHRIDKDPTSTPRDRFIDAALWWAWGSFAAIGLLALSGGLAVHGLRTYFAKIRSIKQI